MWYVENINGDGNTVRRYFDAEQEAIDYSQWTAGEVKKDNTVYIVETPDGDIWRYDSLDEAERAINIFGGKITRSSTGAIIILIA